MFLWSRNSFSYFYSLKYFLFIMLLVFPVFSPLSLVSPNPPTFPPQFMSIGSTHKFFEFSVFYTIFFYLSPSIFIPTHHASSSFYLFPPNPPFPLPTELPLCDVHFSDSVPVLVVCLVFVFIVFLFFQVHLLIVVSLLSFYWSYF